MSGKLKVAIVDYGVGNTHSVANALRFLGYDTTVTSVRAELAAADVLLLPGVGAFGPAMDNLRRTGLADALGELVTGKKKPLLGICLGMQVLATDSDENGLHQGLGFVPGHVRRLQVPAGLSVPQVGWNDLEVVQRHPLFDRVGDKLNFYFDHSYHFECEDRYLAASCDYGGRITAAVHRDNVFGVQFHPEKSQSSGLRLLRGFFLAVSA